MKLWIQRNVGIGHGVVTRCVVLDMRMIDQDTMAVLVDDMNSEEINTNIPFDLEEAAEEVAADSCKDDMMEY